MANNRNTQRSASPQASVLVNPDAVDTNTATQKVNKAVNELNVKRKQSATINTNEEKVRVTGSPMYRPYFGNNMPICVNTIKIYLPLDGNSYEIPKTFAAEFYRRIHRIDEQISLRNKMADVRNNNEAYAGELNLITKV